MFRLMVSAVATWALLVPTFARAEDEQASLARMAWLEGTWQRTDLPPGESGQERWQRTDGGGYVGTGVHERDAGRRFEEGLRIEVQDGTVVYLATTPQNVAPVAFALTSIDVNGMVFENPAHDFPKRIAYRRSGADGMAVRIDGDGKAADFRFRRDDEPRRRPTARTGPGEE